MIHFISTVSKYYYITILEPKKIMKIKNQYMKNNNENYLKQQSHMRSETAINVTKTWMPDKDKYKSYVDKIYETGWVTSYSPLVQELEKRLTAYLNVKNIVLVSSGTAALEIAYKLLKLKGEVITTPFSFIATTSSLVNSGLKPIYADIDPQTFNMDPENIEALITEKTSAIVPVHVFGNACEMDSVEAIAKKHDLKVIYDAAHTFDVDYEGESILKCGDVSVISFQATKLFHTIEGGAIIIEDDDMANEAKMLSNFGINGSESIGYLGMNAKMNEFQAAMGLCVLDDIEYILQERKRISMLYKDHLSEKVQLQKQNVKSTKNYSYVPIVLPSEEKCLEIQHTLNEHNIYPRRYFYPSLDTLDFIEIENECAVSRSISSRILCLPIYPGLEEKIIMDIVQVVNSIVNDEEC